MTQSPSKIMSAAIDDKNLVKGVGYFTIFSSDTSKFELSAKGTSLRKTIYEENGKKAREYLYVKFDNPDKIREIEESVSKWRTYDGGRYGYIVRGQLNEEGKPNGIYKVVESHKVGVKRSFWSAAITSIDSNIGDWTYYKRRSINE